MGAPDPLPEGAMIGGGLGDEGLDAESLVPGGPEGDGGSVGRGLHDRKNAGGFPTEGELAVKKP
jgi:hypothetical protein